MLLLNERQTNPTMMTATRLLATLDIDVHYKCDRIYHAESLQHPASHVSITNMQHDPCEVRGNPAHKQDHKPLSWHSDGLSLNEDVCLVAQAWRRLQLLFVLVSNPELETWNMKMQKQHFLATATKKLLGPLYQNDELVEDCTKSIASLRGTTRAPNILDADQIGQLRTAFCLIDRDQDGIIGVDDLR